MFRGSRYANVVSTLALIVALGGTSYAAVKLPKDSVGTPQLKDNAVKSAKVKDGEITTKDVKNGSLVRGDFAAGQLPSTTIPTSAPGVALAAVTSPGITVSPTNTVWFNRLGGAPTIVKSPDTNAVYTITFPGLAASTLTNVVAVGTTEGGFLSTKISGGGLVVQRFQNNGTAASGPFSVVLFSASPTG